MPNATRLPSFRMARRSQRSASSIKWVVTISGDALLIAEDLEILPKGRAGAPGSRPVVGSSKQQNFGMMEQSCWRVRCAAAFLPKKFLRDRWSGLSNRLAV